MEGLIIAVFALGYTLIAFEHSLKINKTAIALITGVLCWTLMILADPSPAVTESSAFSEFVEHTGDVTAADSTPYQEFVVNELGHHLTDIAEIIFFLLGAMTIVELVDAHQGFRTITDRIQTSNPRVLLWMISWVAFLLSAILDNLTTTIVMVSLARKLVADREQRLLMVGMIVIAANAGGAWTPMGDVTTTMLWIGGQITTLEIMKGLFIPSVVCLLTPLAYLTFSMKRTERFEQVSQEPIASVGGQRLMLFIGIGSLISVPIFKVATHMPPFSGMLLALGIVWVVSELIHPDLDDAEKKSYTAAGALSRIDVPSILFFLGILLAVSSLVSMQLLSRLAGFLNEAIGNQGIIITLIGLLSAVIDNVPLVAASMGMYDLQTYPTDHFIWEYLAYCAGTGGSVLIIGSAAGVAAMGMEKIDFFWYIRKIGWLALMGYFAGAIFYLLAHA